MSVTYKNFQDKIKELQDKGITPQQYLQDYIKKNPDKADKINAALKKYKDPNLVAEALIYKHSKPSVLQDFTSAFKEAGSETFGNLDALVGRLLGSSMYKQRAAQWKAQAQEYSNPNAKEIFDVSNAGEAAHSLARMFGSLGEFGVEMALGGFEGKAAKGAIDLLAKTGAEKATGEAFLKKAAEQTAEKTGLLSKIAPTAEQAGAYTQVTLPEVEKQYEAGGEQHPFKAALGGALTGALYTLSPFKALGAFSETASKGISDEIAALNKSTSMIDSPVMKSLKEGIEQSAILGTATATEQLGSNQPLNAESIGKSALLGGILGTASRGAGELIAKKPKLEDYLNLNKENTENVKSEQEDLFNNVAEKEAKRGAIVPVKSNLREEVDFSTPEEKAPYAKNYEALLTPVGEGKFKKNTEQHSNFIRRAFKDDAYKEPLKTSFDKVYPVLKSAGISDREIMEKYGKEIPKNKADLIQTNSIVPVSKPKTYEHTPDKYLDVIQKSNPKILDTPVKETSKIAYAHKSIIQRAFDKDEYKNRIKKDFNKTYKVLKSAGISDTDILKKHYKDISPKDYTKDMVDALSNPFNEKITDKNMVDYLSRVATMYKKAPDNPHIKSAYNKGISDLKSVVKDKVESIKTSPEFTQKSMEGATKTLERLSKSKKEDFVNSLAEIHYTLQNVDKLKEKYNATSEQINKLKSDAAKIQSELIHKNIKTNVDVVSDLAGINTKQKAITGKTVTPINDILNVYKSNLDAKEKLYGKQHLTKEDAEAMKTSLIKDATDYYTKIGKTPKEADIMARQKTAPIVKRIEDSVIKEKPKTKPKKEAQTKSKAKPKTKKQSKPKAETKTKSKKEETTENKVDVNTLKRAAEKINKDEFEYRGYPVTVEEEFRVGVHADNKRLVGYRGDNKFNEKRNKSEDFYTYITPPPELKSDVLETFESYIKHIGIDLKELTAPKNKELLEDFKNLYEVRKKQAKEGITEDNLKAVAESISVINTHIFKGDKEKIKRLSAEAQRLVKGYTERLDKVTETIDKIFQPDIKANLERMFGKEFADKIKVKSISQITLEDLGGREAVLKLLKEDYNVDLSNLSDKELLSRLKSVKGSLITTPKDGSILVMLSHHANDNITQTLYHEVFHIFETHNLLPKEDIDFLKKEMNKRYPDDDRAWYEKAADDFSIYMINKNKFSGKIKELFQKVKQFLNRLRLGFKQTPEDIYLRILKGDYKPNEDFVAYTHYKTPRFKVNKEDIKDPFTKKIFENSGKLDQSLKEEAIEKTRKAVRAVMDFFLDFGRGIAPKLHNEKFILYEDAVRRAAALKQIAHHRAQKDLLEITEGLNPTHKLLMERVVILRDIKYGLDNKIQTFNNVKKQWGNAFKSESDVAAQLKEAERDLARSAKTSKALQKRVEKYNDVLGYLQRNGYIGKDQRLDPNNYFHRISAAYFNQKIKLHTTYMGEVPVIDPLRERVNSTEKYLTDIVYSDYEALVQFHMLKEYDKIIKSIKKASDPTLAEMRKDFAKISDKDPNKVSIKKMLEALNRTEFKKKYEDYTVKSIEEIPHYYTVWTMGDDLAQKILEESITPEDMGKLKDGISKGLGIVKYSEEVLIPKEALIALKRITDIESPSPMLKIMQWNVALFKKFVLFSPFRFIKYSLNNFTSDTDVIMAVDPTILYRYGLPATKKLFNYYYKKGKGLDKETKENIEEAIEGLVLGTNLTSEEVVSIESLDQFKDFMGTKPNIYNRWWDFTGRFNNYRESILRLAVYNYYKDRIAAGKLKETPITMDYKLTEPYLKAGMHKELAAKLARDLIGDYGNISPSGQWLRKNLIPFWSWTEVNIPRYIKLFKNAAQLKGKYGKLYPLVFAAKASILYSAINLWNYAMFPNASALINDANNGQLHLILGQTDDGHYTTLRFQGSLNDALDWLGLGNIVEIAKEVKEGQITLPDVFKQMPKAAANKLINMSMPIQKTVIEDMAGLSFYPDVTNPQVIRDKWQHALALYGMGLPYKLMFSGDPVPKSQRGLDGVLGTIIKNSAFYTTDLNTANYHIVRELVNRYAQRQGIERKGFIHQEKSDYAFYFRKAVQYGDKEKAIHFLAMYYYKGGNLKSMNKSIAMMNPLRQIPKSKWADFYKTLSAQDKYRLQQYQQWYRSVFLNKSKFSRKELLEIYRKAYKLSLNFKKR